MTDTGTLVRIEADGEGHVVEIVLDRPEALNAVSTAMATALAAATARVAADPNVRCVVLRSSQERAFCVGADLKERNAFTFNKCEDGVYCEERPAVITLGGEVIDKGGPLF